MTMIFPPAAPVVLDTGLVGFPDNGANPVQVATLTLNRTGQWQVFVAGTIDQFATNASTRWQLLVDGVGTVFDAACNRGQDGSKPVRMGGDWRGASDGTKVVRLYGGRQSDGFGQTVSARLYAVFIPTATAIK